MASSDHRAHEETLAAVTPGETGAAGASHLTEPPPQVVAGRYEILGLLGVGGMGSVYKVRDRALDEIVALKVLRRDWIDAPGTLERFRREVKLARRVTHRNVARTFDLGDTDAEKFLTMELIDGPSLGRVLDDRGALPVVEVLRIASGIAEALEAAHAAGVVHRDLKPDNVLLEKSGRVVVTDFGIARSDAGDAGMTGAGALVGTPAYMAPEQVEGVPVDARADLYALGLVLYEMLAGARAWPGDSPFAVAAARLIHPAPAPSRADLPPPLAALVRRLLERKAGDRPQSATQVRADLAAIQPTAVSLAPASAPAVAHTTRTLAVMPVRMSGASEDAWVAEGFTDDLLDGLCMVRELRVRTRSNAVTGEDGRAFGARLGVELVVEGTARRVGDDVRVQLRLSSASDGYQIWAGRFSGALGDLILLADRAAREIAEAAGAAARTPMPSRPSVDPRALELHARARRIAAGSAFDEASGLAAIDEAARLAPSEPRILATQGMLCVKETFRIGADLATLLGRARQVVERAIDIAPELSEPWVALAHLRNNTGDGPGAARAARRALRAGPSVAEAHEIAGRILAEAGRLDDARALLSRAVWLDELLSGALADLVRVLALLGRRADALAQMDRVARVTPGIHVMVAARYDRWWPDAGIVVPEGHFEPGSIGDRLSACERHVRAARVFTPEHDALVREAITRLPPGSRLRRFIGQGTAELHAFLGRDDPALAAIEGSVADGLEDFAWLEHCPLLDPLRSAPRFLAARAIVSERRDAVLRAWDES